MIKHLLYLLMNMMHFIIIFKKCLRQVHLMGESIKLFLVEGEDRDYRFINRMTNCFFKGNIY